MTPRNHPLYGIADEIRAGKETNWTREMLQALIDEIQIRIDMDPDRLAETGYPAIEAIRQYIEKLARN